MKILHIVPSIRIGGVLSVAYNLIKHQRYMGDEVVLYVSRPELKFRDKEHTFHDLGVKLIYSKYSNIYDPRHILELKRIMKDVDVTHVHLFPHQLWANLAYRILPTKKRPILITTEHSTYNNRRKYPILRYLDRFVYSAFDQIISISQQTKTNLDNWLSSPALTAKNIVINNGVDLNAIVNAPIGNLSNLNLPRDSKIVVMVARLAYPKDPLTLVSAIKKCPDNVHAVFIGEGPLESEIKIKAYELGIENRIHTIGLRDDVPSLLKTANIGVLSTNWDGFGLVAVEYMAAGLPVLASDVDGLRDVVGKKECLFSVGDSEKLASLITNVLFDEEMNKELINFFSNRCQSFDVNNTNHEYYQVLIRLIKNKYE